MEWGWIWKSIVIVLGGTLLLRIAGRKTISQMTLAQTIIMIAIGSLLIQPIAGENVWITLGASAVLIGTLIAMEWGQVKSDKVEQWITGKALMIIENGALNERNLRKLRLTVDQLEMRLRLNNVIKISDVEYATLEPNGQLGYILREEARPAARQDIDALKEEIKELRKLVDKRLPYVKLVTSAQKKKKNRNKSAAASERPPVVQDGQNIFVEVMNKAHQDPPPKHLQ